MISTWLPRRPAWRCHNNLLPPLRRGMAAHPSLAGIATDTGLSGSTAWHNSVRARMYLKAAPGDDIALRVLECKKNNYGPVTATVLVRWKDGVYVVEPGEGSLEKLARQQAVEDVFITLLRRFTSEGRNVTDKVSELIRPGSVRRTAGSDRRQSREQGIRRRD